MCRPGVVGEQFNAAKRTLEDEGFAVVTPPNRVPQDQFPDADPREVVAQDPAADEQAAEGSEIALSVVAEPEAVVIPTGLNQARRPRRRGLRSRRSTRTSTSRPRRSRAARSAQDSSREPIRLRARRSSMDRP